MAARKPVAISARSLLLLLMGPGTVGCGAASPLLHPAHVLKQNQISVGSGVTSRIVYGTARAKIDAAQSFAAANVIENGDDEQTYIEGALLRRSLEPTTSPWIGGRVGLGHQSEAGMSYTGHRIRIDGRYQLGDDVTALSVGAAVNVLLHQLEAEPNIEQGSPGGGNDQRLARESLDFSGTGWGIELPVLFGTRRFTRWLEPSIGIRLGYERTFGNMLLTQDYPLGSHAQADAQRLYADGIVGLSAGSEPVFLRMELLAGINQMFGSVEGIGTGSFPSRRDFSMKTLSIQPSAALVFEL